MKCYFDYKGTVPSGVEVVREGKITRIYFDFATEQKQFDEGEPVTVLTAENVDVNAIDYGSIVSAIVRDRYPQDRVEAILANGTDTEAHAAEFAAFQQWRTKAKEVANAAVSVIVGAE